MPFDGTGYDNRIVALDRIDRVIALLAREDRWCKQQLRSFDGKRCVLGAMMAADSTLVLKAPVLQAIREVTGRDYLRIEIFNDHPATNHALVLQVLHRARERIAAGAEMPVVAPSPSRGALWKQVAQRPFAQLRALFV